VKLHLGCGKRYLKDFIHIDIAEFDHIDYFSPVDDLSMFKNDSIEEIYASHVLEYFDKDYVQTVLKEWKRVLVPNGMLRLAVPNFEALIEVYNSTADISKILGPLYGKWNIGNGDHIYHKIVYDYESLEKVLTNAGFKNIETWDWRKVFKNNKDFDDHSQAYFPHMEKDSGIHVSLNLQCRK